MAMTTQQARAELEQLEREHARLKRLAAQPDPRRAQLSQDPAAAAARRERRMAMTGQRERLVPGR